MIEATLLAARHALFDRADAVLGDTSRYCRHHGINIMSASRHIGGAAVLPVADHGNCRFDFGEGQDAIEAFVLEAFGIDDERVVDLVAWPVLRPHGPMTMFGRVGLLGISSALNPATYFMGAALRLLETPLEWLRADCQGAAVVIPHLAARQLRDLPGPIAAIDVAHGRRLQRLMDSVPKPTILVPERRAA